MVLWINDFVHAQSVNIYWLALRWRGELPVLASARRGLWWERWHCCPQGPFRRTWRWPAWSWREGIDTRTRAGGEWICSVGAWSLQRTTNDHLQGSFVLMQQTDARIQSSGLRQQWEWDGQSTKYWFKYMTPINKCIFFMFRYFQMGHNNNLIKLD